LPNIDSIHRRNFLGPKNSNLSLIEKLLGLHLSIRNNRLIVIASNNQQAHQAHDVVHQMMTLSSEPITPSTIESIIYQETPLQTLSKNSRRTRKFITPKNHNQAAYIASMKTKAITFAVGPAGTGKTYLAVNQAVESFEKGEVQRLIFVRPAVEAGEKLGFLPGDLVEKVLPYLRPIYDSLYEMLGFQETQKLIQNDIIEVLPLAFMRGRTLNEAFIILDEAQNATVLQMKMFLTRMGFSSRVVITGDTTQTDLPKGTQSGLTHAVHIFKDIDDIAIHHFDRADVVRHPLITQIIERYEQDEENK
jgi:phosphate starvation-inducible PhoH-like protein